MLFSLANVNAYQDDLYLEVTMHGERETNSLELKGSELMTIGTHSFYETPLLNLGGSEHDITRIDVSNIQYPSFNNTDTQDYSLDTGVNATVYANSTLSFNQSIEEYTCDAGFDTVISVNLNYYSSDDHKIQLLHEDFEGAYWSLYDTESTYITYASYLDQDSMVSSLSPTMTYGSSYTMYVGTLSTYYSFLNEDIPYLHDLQECKYQNSILSLYCHYMQSPSTANIRVRQSNSFNEATLCWNNQPSVGSIAQNNYQITVNSWNQIPLSIVYEDYRVEMTTSSNYLQCYSKDNTGTTYDPYITHFLNKFFQTTYYGCMVMQTATNQEMLNAKSPTYSTTTVTAGDHIKVELETESSEQLTLGLWKEGVLQKELEILPYGNTDHSRHTETIIVDEYVQFDQMSINGKFDDTEYIKVFDITVDEYIGKDWFSNCYVENFTYSVLGQNYTESYELVLDEENDETATGNYSFYFDSTFFQNRTELDDVVIPEQNLTIILTLNSDRDVSLTIDVSYSSNTWRVPSEVNLKINGDAVLDESYNSGFVALAAFPSTLEITSDIGVFFKLDITTVFTFTFNLDVISKTYLRKTFELESDHDVVFNRIDFEPLTIKKIYLNNIDLGDDNPNILEPLVTMNPNESFQSETSEMSHSYYPDDHSSTYGFSNGLSMQNEFPNEYYEEDWENWTLDHDSDYTSANFSDGTLNTQLNNNNNNTNIPSFENITLLEGALLQNGTEYLGNNSFKGGDNYQAYAGLFNFENESMGNTPISWSAGTIVQDLSTHRKSALIPSVSCVNYVTKTEGTIEFYWKTTDNTQRSDIVLCGTGSPAYFVWLCLDSGVWRYQNGASFVVIPNVDNTPDNEVWYHFQIDFRCNGGLAWKGLSNNRWKVSIDGVNSGELTPRSTQSTIYYLSIAASTNDFYFDAVDYSWESGYYDNRNQDLESFEWSDDKPFNWFLETQSKITVDSDKLSHKNVMDLHDTGGTRVKASQIFDEHKTVGTIEYYVITTDATDTLYCYVNHDATNNDIILMYINADYLTYNDGTPHNIMPILDNVWYHIRIEFDVNDDWHLWVDGVSKDAGVGYGYYGTPTSFSRMMFFTNAGTSNEHFHIDAVDYSWTVGYYDNRNTHQEFANLSVIDNDYIVLESANYELNTTITIPLPAVNLNNSLSSFYLDFSHKTDESQLINMSIYNYNTKEFDLINSSTNNAGFFNIISGIQDSNHANESVLIQFYGIDDNTDFQLYIEKLIISYMCVITSGNLNATITKVFTFNDFLNRYDSGFDIYQKLFNVTIALKYRFTRDILYDYFAELNSSSLNVDGSWHFTQITFEFNSSSLDNITYVFKASNGILEIDNLNYTITFNCLDNSSKTRLYQYFKFDPVFSTVYSIVTESDYILNFSLNTESFLALFDYSRNNTLELIVNIQCEDSWLTSEYFHDSSIQEVFSLNISEFLLDNGKERFLDFSLEIYLSGNQSQLEINNLYLFEQLITHQLTTSPDTETDSVEFMESLIATQDFRYWYLQNELTINDLSLVHEITGTTITSFDENSSKYYFEQQAREDDIFTATIDYDPNWNVNFEIQANNGTYSLIKIDYNADLTINNVDLILDLSASGCLNDNWTLNATQNDYTFKLTIPGIRFTNKIQTIYIEGFSDVPYASLSSYESDQNWNRISVDTVMDFAGFISYPKYSRLFLLNKETSWSAYNVYYGSEIYAVESISSSLISISGNGFDPSITDSYLHFSTSPFLNVDFEYDGATIKIIINCSLDVDNAYFLYAFDPSGVHNLAVSESNNSISLSGLTDIGDMEGYLYFACSKIYAGVTYIEISVNFVTPLEMVVQSIIIFVVAGIAIVGYYYVKNNDKKVQMATKRVSKKIMSKLKRKKKEEGFKEVSFKIKNDKLYLENKS